MHFPRYRMMLLLSTLTALLFSGTVAISTTAMAASGGPAPTCTPTPGIAADTARKPPAVFGSGELDCVNSGSLGIEVTLTENGVDVAQRRALCSPDRTCATDVKTSYEPGKVYCVRVYSEARAIPEEPGSKPETAVRISCL